MSGMQDDIVVFLSSIIDVADILYVSISHLQTQ
jgi:hypothetical protein